MIERSLVLPEYSITRVSEFGYALLSTGDGIHRSIGILPVAEKAYISFRGLFNNSGFLPYFVAGLLEDCDSKNLIFSPKANQSISENGYVLRIGTPWMIMGLDAILAYEKISEVAKE